MKLNQTIYMISRPVGGLRVARFLSRKHPKIIMYHRVTIDGSNGSISVDQFRAQMKIVKQYFNPLTLSELVGAYELGEIPNNAVVITIDDGYFDFADYTWPILQEIGIPATIFITTGFVNRDLWLWPDEIKYAIRCTKKREISLPVLGEVIIKNSLVNAWNTLADYCLTVQNQEKNNIIDWLYCELEVERPVKAPSEFSAVSWDQLKGMVASGLEVGSHSHTHPILTKLNQVELHEELYLSKALIKKNLDIDPTSFCYPNGMSVDFDQNIKELVNKAGYKYAVAAFPAIRPLSDRWAINRYAASRSQSLFEKNIFGLSYLGSVINNY